MRKPKWKRFQKLQRSVEEEEIELLNSWIESQKPDSGSNPMSFDPLPREAKVGRLDAQSYSRYAGVIYFNQLPISKKTKDGLRQANFTKMTDIQRACLPHALCGRDILGAAKTGSGKTLAFVIPVLEKLYRERWAPQFGVGCIIISPTRELAGQLFDVLKAVGRHHKFSAGLLIGGRKDVDTEKEHVNDLNILVCTPGRLLQHLDETPNFDCSQLQVLVLDEADRILDKKFERDLNAVISQLPKHRQTLLFSATQTKSVQDLARLSLKDPEYLGVHEESTTATPTTLQQSAMIVPLNQKLDMLWSFIRRHLKSRILVFLSSCKQVRFVFETFKKLRPGIPLKCLHGRMKQETRMAIYMQFCEMHSVLFSTDVAARGLDFNKGVDWVVQVDCPENIAAYIHRVGRTARYLCGGRSLLFIMPSEMKMIEKLRASKVPIEIMKPRKKYLEPISGLLSALMVKYPDMQQLAQRAFITYLKSIHIQKDKEIFDILKLPLEEFSASLGLPIPPKIRFLGQKLKGKAASGKSTSETEIPLQENLLVTSREMVDMSSLNEDEQKEDLQKKQSQDEGKQGVSEAGNNLAITRASKKKKLKINVHKPTGTKVVFDEEGNALDPSMADAQDENDSLHLDQEKRNEYYEKLRAQLKRRDKEDKLLHHQRLREKRIKEKEKWKGGNMEREGSDEDLSGSEEEAHKERPRENGKIYFSDDDDDDDDDDAERTEVANNAGISAKISLLEQEALALKLLNSMHS